MNKQTSLKTKESTIISKPKQLQQNPDTPLLFNDAFPSDLYPSDRRASDVIMRTNVVYVLGFQIFGSWFYLVDYLNKLTYQWENNTTM